MPFGLRHVISGILAGGSWFPHGVMLLLSPVWPCVCMFSAFLWLLSCCFGHTRMWWHKAAITTWIHQWTGCQSCLCVGFWLVLFVVWFCVLFGFVLCVFAVCLVYDDDGPMDYVQILPSSLLRLNSRWPGTLICNYCSCNVIQCGKRPGESHEGVGRKRDLSDLARFH